MINKHYKIKYFFNKKYVYRIIKKYNSISKLITICYNLNKKIQ
jgi:hypothetical protein